MVTTKSRAAKSGAAKSNTGPSKSRATRARLASQPRPGAKPATGTQDAAADLVVAGVSVAVDAPQEPPVTDEDDAAVVFKKKHLVDRVQALSGGKKREVKDIVEATLAVIAEALASGDPLALPPLGRLTVNRQKDLASGEVMIVKIRRHSPGKNAADKAGTDPLADDGEDG